MPGDDIHAEADPATPLDDDAPGPPISVPDSGDAGEGGKLKMIVQLVKKCLGVKDIAAMRLSLPASLLEPIPNLEYWHYLDRPDVFAAINDSEDPFERMLAVLRFSFTKELRLIHGKICKPYNSVLGEHFRAHWDVVPLAYAEESSLASAPLIFTTPAPSSINGDAATAVAARSETASVKSIKSTRSGISFMSKAKKSPSTAATSPTNTAALLSNLSLVDTGNGGSDTSSSNKGDNSTPRLRVVYLTEQVSHHPPVSAYYASCPSRSLEMFGIDQISAKVSGTTLRVSPGQFNQGIFVNITGGSGEGERYHITHPVGSVNGILRGSFYATFGESTIITCSGGKPGHKFRAVVEYKEESWLGRAHFLVEGVVHTVTEGDSQHEEWTRVKHVPRSQVVAEFDGSWKGRIRWRRVGAGSYLKTTSSSASSPAQSHSSLSSPSIPSPAASKVDVADGDYTTLLDLSALYIIPKTVRPIEKQLPDESRKLWQTVTERLVNKEFSEATREKVVIEQKQREDAAERKRMGVEFVPRYFNKDMEEGFSTLTPEGQKAVEEELQEESLEGSEDVNSESC